MGEPGIIARAEAIKHPLRLGERGRPGEAQLRDEAVLEGAEEALDAAFRLGRVGADPVDAQFMEGTADLGGLGATLELLGEGEREPRIAMKDPMPIGVGGAGEAVAANEAAEEQKVAMGVLLETEDALQDLSGGIVQGSDEDEAGTPVLKPGVMTAIHLDQEARLRHALAAAAMPGWAPGAGAANPGGAEQALHGRAGEVDPFPILEELREVMIVHARVGGAGQREDAVADGLRQAVGRGVTAVAMREGGEAPPPESGEKATDVAEGQAQERGGLRGLQGPMLDL